MMNGGRRFLTERKRIVELAGKYRLPAIYHRRSLWMRVGSCPMGRTRLTYFGARGLRGQDFERSQTADLPVQQATKFEFVINLKAAKQIGLTIPPTCWRGRIK